MKIAVSLAPAGQPRNMANIVNEIIYFVYYKFLCISAGWLRRPECAAPVCSRPKQAAPADRAGDCTVLAAGSDPCAPWTWTAQSAVRRNEPSPRFRSCTQPNHRPASIGILS